MKISRKTYGYKLEENSLSFEKKPVLQMRWLLTLLGFLMYLLLNMVKTSFAVAIVAMVNLTTTDSNDTNNDVCESAANSTGNQSSNTEGEFFWSEAQQGQILAAYLWGMFLARFFGGRLGEVYGQRFVITVGLVSSGILEVLCPTIASAGPYALFAARFLLGVSVGPNASAYQSLLSKWAPRHELATMMSASFTGLGLGGMLGVTTAGFVSENFGWRWIFWCDGILVLLFTPFWVFFVRNDPDNHPLITHYERKILEENRNVTTKKTVPWKKISKSPYLYIFILGQFARSWADGIMNVEGPSFFSKKLGLDLSTASYVVGVMSIIGIPSLLIYGWISDTIIRRKYVSRVVARKIMHFIGTGIFGILNVSVALSGCNVTLAITFFLMFGLVFGATCASLNVSVIDIAPNYAGTITGLIGFGNIGAALSPLVISAFIQQTNGWSKVFYTNAGLSFVSCLVYILFITDQPQSWNYDDDDKKKTKVSTISREVSSNSESQSTYL